MPPWFKSRNYRHLDVPVNKEFAQKVQVPRFVARHAFSPLIHYDKPEKRYRKAAIGRIRAVSTKLRPIKYASHRDACIFSWYAYQLNENLRVHYKSSGLDDKVIAYRPLGRSNYHFSAEAFAFAHDNAPAMILAFDISNFFDELDHGLLKRRLKNILDVSELPVDWLKVYNAITRFHFVKLDELKRHHKFSTRFSGRTTNPIASVKELKSAGITFYRNPGINADRRRGIPQGTPISAAASNLYMVEFDAQIAEYCDGIGALYRRYSDDILIVCKPEDADAVEKKILALISKERLTIQSHKTEKTLFDVNASTCRASCISQYLGFTFDKNGAAIRERSLAKQWRKMRRAFRRTHKVAKRAILDGTAERAYTKRLRRRFTHLKVYDGETTRTIRNFSSYARRSADAFGENEKITVQIKKFERAVAREFQSLKALNKTTTSSR